MSVLPEVNFVMETVTAQMEATNRPASVRRLTFHVPMVCVLIVCWFVMGSQTACKEKRNLTAITLRLHLPLRHQMFLSRYSLQRN